MQVIIGEEDGGRAGDTRSHRTHTGRKDGGYQQARQSHGKFVHNEERKHEIGSHTLGQQARIHLIERIQTRANQEENGRHGNKQIPTEQGRELRLLHALGGVIALHIVLVDAIVLKVGKDAVNHAHPEGGFAQAGTEASQTELIVFPSDAESLHRPFGHIEEQKHEAKQGSAYQDDALNGFRPNHRLDASYHGIGHDGNGRNEDNRLDVPPQQLVHGQGQEIKDGTHAGYLSEQIERRGIHPRPSPEALFQEAIGRHTLLVPVEGHEILGRKERSYGDGKAEHERIPVARKGLTGITQIADAAHIGSEDGHAHHPTGQAPPSRSELVRRGFLVEERTPEKDYPSGEQQKYDDVYDMHTFIFYTYNYCHPEEHSDEGSREHPRVCFRDSSLRSE